MFNNISKIIGKVSQVKYSDSKHNGIKTIQKNLSPNFSLNAILHKLNTIQISIF